MSPDRARQLLVAERSRAALRLGELHEDQRGYVDDFVLLTELHLIEVAAALARLDAGAYGHCRRCGVRLPESRLETRPSAPTCVSCA